MRTSYNYPEEYHTEVYISDGGSITILQSDPSGNPPESVAFVSKDRAIAVANAILALAEIATFGEVEEP